MDNNQNDVNPKNESKKSKFAPDFSISVIALALDLAAPVIFFLGVAAFASGFLALLGLLLMILAIACPFAAIVMGICALCLGKNKIGKAGIGFSVAAIAIPVIFVLVMILLFSTGAVRISLM